MFVSARRLRKPDGVRSTRDHSRKDFFTPCHPKERSVAEHPWSALRQNGKVAKEPYSHLPSSLSLSLTAALPCCGVLLRVLPGTALPLWALWGPP